MKPHKLCYAKLCEGRTFPNKSGGTDVEECFPKDKLRHCKVLVPDSQSFSQTGMAWPGHKLINPSSHQAGGTEANLVVRLICSPCLTDPLLVPSGKRWISVFSTDDKICKF